MTDADRDPGATVDAYFAAMRRGAAAEDDMLALFADDAVYAEPFSGSEEPAVGKAAVRARLRQGWEAPLPDLELDVLFVDVTGETATARWECRSSAFPAPVRGVDEYEFRDGLISRLTVRIERDA
ncbi:MAG: nuclear transport factor 2 family protein [Actinomycetota bacterium]